MKHKQPPGDRGLHLVKLSYRIPAFRHSSSISEELKRPKIRIHFPSRWVWIMVMGTMDDRSGMNVFKPCMARSRSSLVPVRQSQPGLARKRRSILHGFRGVMFGIDADRDEVDLPGIGAELELEVGEPRQEGRAETVVQLPYMNVRTMGSPIPGRS